MLIHYLSLLRTITTIVFTRNAVGRNFMLHRALTQARRHTHPIDLIYGIQTSGFVPNFLTDPGLNIFKIGLRENNHYAGCQPSCVRIALRSLPDTAQFTFYDLGCGMGRALITASEFPFYKLIGIEISGELCAIAEKNVQKISDLFPGRAKISIDRADVTTTQLKGGKIVVFMYHSFGRATIGILICKLEQLAIAGSSIFVIFENPVNGDLVDQSIYFKRWYAEQVPCDPDELNHHSDTDDGVVVWQSINTVNLYESRCSDFNIITTKPTWRAEIVFEEK
ncbi:class I SAM-dependent methyltransferase [Methylobacterium sp. J-026]|jgi:SAM-dependent methyltransferase|uniref:class I SAM-dependent methyltransferase n=1 Tax=Methylobacterium sp. J-026 TaxID=2836624 RepID=UPI001FBA5525|nr:class I SAM-dependent methyltransferase [Methylobacterium sp. J-026]MCJ2138098.1 class I SAM-dependent methyltransferase [Methylobacterium sp. J-026]